MTYAEHRRIIDVDSHVIELDDFLHNAARPEHFNLVPSMHEQKGLPVVQAGLDRARELFAKRQQDPETMAKFEKTDSEYISGNDLVGIEGVRFEILTEAREESTNFGIKPKCSVKVLKNGVTSEQKWNLNLQNINFLIDNFGGESTAWIGKSVGVYVENIKGNNAIRIKA